MITLRSISNTRLLKNSWLLFLLIYAPDIMKAQDTLKRDKSLYYRLTIVGGPGRGYPLQEKGAFGIGRNIEFAIQKKKVVYSVGFRGLTEFQILSIYDVSNSVSSVDFTYGRVFQTRSFFSSISAGIGYVSIQQRVDYFTGDAGISYHSIGLPLSLKAFWIPAKFYGLGLELFLNLNERNTFYGVNLGLQLGRLKAGKLKTSTPK